MSFASLMVTIDGGAIDDFDEVDEGIGAASRAVDESAWAARMCRQAGVWTPLSGGGWDLSFAATLKAGAGSALPKAWAALV